MIDYFDHIKNIQTTDLNKVLTELVDNLVDFQFRNPSLEDDKKFQMQAVIRNAECLKRINSYDYSYEEWKELYLHAITTDANMAGNLGWDDKSGQLKKDKDFWLAAISLNVDVYNYIPREFEEDLDICRIIFQKDQRGSRHYLPREVIYQLEDEMV